MNRIIGFLVAAIVCSVAFAYLVLHKENNKENNKDSSFCPHLRVNLLEGDPPSLHPHLGADIRGRILGKSLFEGLTRLGDEGQGELAAAEKVELDPSCTRYTFHIRSHLWSNDQPVTAHHFEQAWKKAIHPDSICARADLFYTIKNARKVKCRELPLEEAGIKALDDKTFIVELENPAPYFLQLISHPLFSPLFNDDPEPTVFNGPFKISKWERGNVLELDKNLSYWDRQSVQLEKVSIFMVPDIHTEFALFEKQDLDIVGDCFDAFSLDVLLRAMDKPNFRTQEISRVFWLYINTTQFPFQSEKIRQAFAYALDRDFLTRNFLLGDIPCGTILPRTLTLLEGESMDKNSAQALQLFEEGMQESGLTRETFPAITLSYCTYGSQKGLSELIQESLQKVLGIQVNIQNYEWNMLQENMVRGEFQLASCLRHAVYEDPLYFLDIFKSKGNSYNYARWENETYKSLLNLASATTDPSERKNYLSQAERLLTQAMPVIPIYTETCKYVTQDNIVGYHINRSGYTDFKSIASLR
jgi:oligopeptide transport system substrate-binding protein